MGVICNGKLIIHQADILRKFGGLVLANACGPCIGQWKRLDITSFIFVYIVKSKLNFLR